MKPAGPVIAIDLFPGLLDGLLDLLASLSAEEWDRQTVCPGWSVKDVATHLLGGDIGILSRRRDGYRYEPRSPEMKLASWEGLVAWIDQLNAAWIQGARRISPRLLCDLLRSTGEQVNAYFRTIDPYAPGEVVSWAGPEPAPNWLDLAREYTERWHHQQHIRQAVDRPGFTEKRYLAPALEAFAWALPHTFQDMATPAGTLVALTITGEAGQTWLLQREDQSWTLHVGNPHRSAAEVILDQDLAWRLYTKGVDLAQAGDRIEIRGDESLGKKLLETVAIIA
jgi:uncharacterized protein (TIGR03083 family)